MDQFLIEARKLAYGEVEKTGMPIKLHVDLATETAQRLAKELGANIKIVEAGTLLMDCLIGQAMKENRSNEHVNMSLAKANELLDASSLSLDEKENIRHCILEHHGVKSFYSIESEVCCNADCYRFISIKGFSYAMRYLRGMPFENLVNLLSAKAEEKWNALSLDVSKNELSNQYKLIMSLLATLSSKS
ncbi:MAG: hypothetical protein WCI93_00135 [bacterium]